ncbi:MAG: glutaredoxin family protein [Thiobacillus sp.]|nr:glutaredoxin family protein [Thiobacillus sp.]
MNRQQPRAKDAKASTLTLYTRAGCPLCEEMAAQVGALIAGTGHRLTPVDVDVDPLLKTRYGWDVPLLFDGATEICRHELNLHALQEWLRRRP